MVSFTICTDTNEGGEKYNKETSLKNVCLPLKKGRVCFSHPKRELVLLELNAGTRSSSVEL